MEPSSNEKKPPIRADNEDLEVAEEIGELEDVEVLEQSQSKSPTFCSPPEGAHKISMWCKEPLKEIPTVQEVVAFYNNGVKKIAVVFPTMVDNMEESPVAFVKNLKKKMDTEEASSLHLEFGNVRELVFGCLRIAYKKKVELFPVKGLTTAMAMVIGKCLLRSVCGQPFLFCRTL